MSNDFGVHIDEDNFNVYLNNTPIQTSESREHSPTKRAQIPL